jgi:hypothetical protein
VSAAAQRPEHCARVGGIAGLAERPSVDDDDRIGRQHDRRRVRAGHDTRLPEREPGYRLRQRHSIERLVGFAGNCLESDAERGQQLTPARRRGRED